ncbi:unnamed protein product, partial [Rotaria socialis]
MQFQVDAYTQFK